MKHIVIISILAALADISASQSTEDITALPNPTTISVPNEDLTKEPATKTSTTTTAAPTTSKTTTSTTTAPPTDQDNERSVYIPGPHCTCDITEHSCDVNCCCDKDCSQSDRSVFSYCIPMVPYNVNQRHCYRTNFIYANNSQYAIAQNPGLNDLFCIYTNNLMDVGTFMDRDPIENITEFGKLKTRHRPFIWPSEQEKENKADSPFSMKNYKAGSPIWTLSDASDSLGLLSLPSQFNSHECNSNSPLRYMEDHSFHCQRSLSTVTDCSEVDVFRTSVFTRGFSVIRHPGPFKKSKVVVAATEKPSNVTDGNSTTKKQSVDYVNYAEPSSTTEDGLEVVERPFESNLIPVVTQLCERNGTNSLICIALNESEPIPDPTTGCKNVLTSLRYEIVHKGVEGIVSVTALVELSTFNLNTDYVKQEFSYTHFWTTDNVTEVRELSGNPGYLKGKPLLSGLVTPTEDDKKTFFIDTTTFKHAVSTMSRSSNGECFRNGLDIASENREPVRFGENVYAGCLFRITRQNVNRDCELLRNRTLSLLTGLPDGMADLQNLRVASMGNSDPQKAGDWAQVILNNAPFNDLDQSETAPQAGVCSSLILSLHIEVVYANIGSVDNPQAKVMGVQYRFGLPHDLRIQCHGLGCHSNNNGQLYEISQSVNFIDISEAPIEKYSEFPVIEAKFPNDFFYPFVMREQPSGEVTSNASDDKQESITVTALLMCLYFNL